jgi:2-succinyl-6-hydroxy-2,4-cyclohexadiene-1-carboxylate synthase
VSLAADHLGLGPRIVLVHGFTQSAASWGRIATDLARDHEVVAVDAPGHGRSGAIRAGLWQTAALLAEFGPAIYIGYSMGARMALHVGLAHPDMVEGLVLLGGTAGIAEDAERTTRATEDDQQAERIGQIGLERFLDEWLAQPMFARIPDDRDTRLTNTATGLASSLRLCGTGSQEPAWDQLYTIRAPSLIVAGGADAKFVALGQRMAAGIGEHARFEAIGDAGHAAHLEQPAEFVRAVRRFLRSVEGTPPPVRR